MAVRIEDHTYYPPEQPYALTPEQRQVLNQIVHGFCPSKDPQDELYYVAGGAGVGKSHLIGAVAHAFPSAKLCAPTGRAASLLAQKIGRPAQTLHRLIYMPDGYVIDRETGRKTPRFVRVPEGALEGTLVLLDECSLVDTKMAEDLFRAGCRVIATGDPWQLPPVSKLPRAFDSPNAQLTTVHRQALDSGIIRQAHKVRTTGRYESDGWEFGHERRAVSKDDYRRADVVLCWKNQTRREVNQRLRAQHGRSGLPRLGEPLVCLRNSHQYGVYNGGVYELAESYSPRSGTIAVRVEGEVVEIPNATFDETDAPPSSNRTIRFDYGYCLTVHRGQGSEWDNVLLIDEFSKQHDDYRAWAYTGITRARQGCLVTPQP